ncbi:MAG: hypothetical protein ACYCVG_05085 [Leptospirillum sp.]
MILKKRVGNREKKGKFRLLRGTGLLCLCLFLDPAHFVYAGDNPQDQTGVPASTMPQVPVFRVSTQPLPKVSDIALSMEIKKAQDVLHNGKYPEAKNLFENILLDYPENRVPMSVYLGLAKANRHMGLATSVLNLLLPLLKSQVLAQSTRSEKTEYMYSIGMADSVLKNDLGTVHYLLPVYKDLARDNRIYQATNVLEPILAKTDPISSIILFSTVRSGMGHDYQVRMASLITSMIMETVTSSIDSQKIWESFPESFPGDVALFKSAQILESTGHSDQAEMEYIHILANYPESSLVQKTQKQLDAIHFTNAQRPVGVIIPDLVKNPVAPYIRSILRGVFTAYSAHHFHRWVPSVKTVHSGSQVLKSFSDLERKEGIVSCIGPILPKDFMILKKRLYSGRLVCVTPTLSPPSSFKGIRSVATMPAMIGKAAAMEVLAIAPKDPAMTLYPDVPYGHFIEKIFSRKLSQGGGDYLQGLAYNPDAPDIQPAVDSMKTFGRTIAIDKDSMKNPEITFLSPDLVRYRSEHFVLFSSSDGGHVKKSFFVPSFRIIFIPDSSGHHARILRELAYKGIQNQLIIGNDTFMTGDPIPDVSILGTIKAVGAFSPNDLPVENPDIRLYNQTFGHLPDLFALQAIDAAEIIDASLVKGVQTSAQTAYSIKKIMNFHGLSGRMRWDTSGQTEKQVSVFGYNDGHWQRENQFWVDSF